MSDEPDARPAQPKLSGNSYVAGWLKGERRGRVVPKIPLAGKRYPCDHTKTICAKCMHEWYDYTLMPHRTAGGRRLLLEREQLGLDNSKWPS